MRTFLFILIAISLQAPAVFIRMDHSDSPFDVFRIMQMVKDADDNPVWPDFRTADIPVMVFDSIDTWLFHSKEKPEGFSEVDGHAGVYRFPGQHPVVRGNSVARFGTGWIATSILNNHSQRTGEKYSKKDLAGIIIHEQFHIFSKTRHPRWVPNDGVLLLYPEETPEALYLRRIEKEAFRRAVTAGEPDDVRGWAKEALSCREQRMKSLATIFTIYEKELQRTEGLSDYIEKKARGLDPLNASTITNGIAPAGVRDLGYVEGRWIAMILDKLNPGWKNLLEENDTLYLEDILKKSIEQSDSQAKSFTPTETEQVRKEAGIDFIAWQEKRQAEFKEFNDLSGYRIEINSAARPLAIRIFEPLEIEIIEPGSVFHRLIFSAGNEAGSLRIMHQPCITWFDNSLRIQKILLNGLKEAPRVTDNEKKIIFRDSNISIDLNYSKLTTDGLVYKVEI
jgi:hypothetical protein